VARLDILMVTYDQPDYLKLSIPRLFETCDDDMRVWLWHNGTDEETLELSKSFAADPRVGRFHHCPENAPLREPLNWLFTESTAPYFSKVDDDCLVEHGWAQTFISAHEDVPQFGAIGCWRFEDEDFDPELAEPKIGEFPGGHKVLQNYWVQGSGFVMKRACIDRYGLIKPKQSFVNYCVDLAVKGWVHGWYYPFVREEHMDDPRSPNTRFRTDEDLQQRLPLTARLNGATTVEAWTDVVRRSARASQAAPLDPAYFVGWARRRRHALIRVRSLLGDKRVW
jgi:Glycosyl transferase family 2